MLQSNLLCCFFDGDGLFYGDEIFFGDFCDRRLSSISIKFKTLFVKTFSYTFSTIFDVSYNERTS